MEWPDIESALITRLVADGHQGEVGTETYPLEGGPDRFTRLHAIGGADNGLTDAARVDVETFAASREVAMDMASELRQWMHKQAGRAVGGVLIDTVRTAQRPTQLPYRNPGVYRVVASYAVETRLQ